MALSRFNAWSERVTRGVALAVRTLKHVGAGHSLGHCADFRGCGAACMPDDSRLRRRRAVGRGRWRCRGRRRRPRHPRGCEAEQLRALRNSPIDSSKRACSLLLGPRGRRAHSTLISRMGRSPEGHVVRRILDAREHVRRGTADDRDRIAGWRDLSRRNAQLLANDRPSAPVEELLSVRANDRIGAALRAANFRRLSGVRVHGVELRIPPGIAGLAVARSLGRKVPVVVSEGPDQSI